MDTREAKEKYGLYHPETKPYRVIGTTYDGVEILAPAVASKNFTPEQVRAAILALSTKAEKGEVEPVAWRARHSEQEKWYVFDHPVGWWECQPLFTLASAEPAASVPEEVSSPVACTMRHILGTQKAILKAESEVISEGNPTRHDQGMAEGFRRLEIALRGAKLFDRPFVALSQPTSMLQGSHTDEERATQKALNASSEEKLQRRKPWAIGDEVEYCVHQLGGPSKGSRGLIVEIEEAHVGRPRSQDQVFWVRLHNGQDTRRRTGPDEVKLVRAAFASVPMNKASDEREVEEFDAGFILRRLEARRVVSPPEGSK